MATDGKQRLTLPPRLKTSVKPSPPSSSASASTQKPQPQQTATEQRPPATSLSPISSSVLSAAKETLRDAALGKRPYLKYAFANPYNLSLLLGALAASVVTLNPFIAIAALGLEGLWLLHGPESKFLRRVLWDPKFEKVRQALERQALEERIKTLQGRDRERVESLVAKQHDIQRLAAQNPSFTGELLRGELQKTGRLVDAFIDMAVTCGRYEEYLNSVDTQELEADRRRWEKMGERLKEDDPASQIAKKNLAVLEKRFEKLGEIRRYLMVAKGQLDLIENSFQLIADQIVTMQSPQELTGQLNELLDGVESIKQTAIDTERILNSL
ncbi:MAG TPA: hypothetical protein VGB73_06020 [Pyrinomonadaceae bacterium]|jgi:hypothetical protein